MSAVAPLPAEGPEPTLDLAALLASIEGSSPTGPSVRDDPDYIALAEARRAENASLPQGIWKRDVKRADWRAVVEQALHVVHLPSDDGAVLRRYVVAA